MQQAKEKKETKKSPRRRRRLLRALLIIAGVLILFRIFLPYIVLNYVNKKLAGLTEYYGHVEDIDIRIIRGAYVIKNIVIEKVRDKGTGNDTVPFFKCPRIDLSVQWSALFKGSVVGEVYVEQPVLNFVKGKHKDEDLRSDTTDFRDLIRDLMPLRVNHFEITDGEIHYIDLDFKPMLDVFMNQINVVATNISNVNDSAKLLPASLTAHGNVYGGNFRMEVNYNILQKVPTFDMNAELTSIELTKLNNFLEAYGNFRVSQGTFGLYTEFAAKEGAFGGYVKPTAKDIKVKIEGDASDVLWELLVGGAAAVLDNPKTDLLATKVPINGKFDNPDINIWRAVSLVLRNAFVQALRPSVDHSINIYKLEEEQPKTLLEKVFGDKKNEKKGDDKNEQKDKKKKE